MPDESCVSCQGLAPACGAYRRHRASGIARQGWPHGPRTRVRAGGGAALGRTTAGAARSAHGGLRPGRTGVRPERPEELPMSGRIGQARAGPGLSPERRPHGRVHVSGPASAHGQASAGPTSAPRERAPHWGLPRRHTEQLPMPGRIGQARAARPAYTCTGRRRRTGGRRLDRPRVRGSGASARSATPACAGHGQGEHLPVSHLRGAGRPLGSVTPAHAPAPVAARCRAGSGPSVRIGRTAGARAGRSRPEEMPMCPRHSRRDRARKAKKRERQLGGAAVPHPDGDRPDR